MSKTYYLLIIGVLLCTSSVQAQTTSAETDTTIQLDDIVIQASKIPVSPRETSRPVTIIDRRQIEQSSSDNLAQLLHNQAGIRINGSQGTPSSNQDLFLQGASGEYTLILIDGVAISDPSGVGGAIDLRLLPLHNVERIEVLKGNQSTLYGSDALAGVINIITNQGAEKIIEPSGSVEYGAYNSFKGSAQLNGALTTNLKYSFGYNRKSSDGISAATPPEGAETFEDDGFSQDSFFGNVTLRPFDGLAIKPFLNYTAYEGDFDAGAFQDAPNRSTNDMWNPGVQAVFERGDLRFNSTYQFTKTKREFSTEFGENLFEGRFQNVDAFANYRLNDFINLMAGLNWQEGSTPADQVNDTPEASASFTSPYATLLLDSGTGLRTEIGFRMNVHSEYGTNNTYSISPSYQINNNLKAFVSLGSGFKTPSLDQLYGQFGANPDLQPETSRNFQVGLEAYLLNQSLKVESHFFDRRIDDLIVYDATIGYLNRDRETTKGLELSFNWLVSPEFSIGGFYNYLTGEVQTLDQSGNEESSSSLIRLPNHNAGLNASYRFANGLLIKLDGEFASERTDLFFNSANNFASEKVTLDSYVLANLYIEYPFFNDQMTLYASIRNLLDSDFTEVYGFNTLSIHARGGVRFRL